MKTVFAVLLLLLSFAANAQTYELTFMTASKHFGGDGRPCNADETGKETMREVNPGIGFRVNFNRTWSVEQAIYANSVWKTSYAILGAWMPIDYGSVRFGLGAGGATGYCTKPVMPIGGLIASFDFGRTWGVDVMGFPPIGPTDGVVTAQVRYRF